MEEDSGRKPDMTFSKPQAQPGKTVVPCSDGPGRRGEGQMRCSHVDTCVVHLWTGGTRNTW